MPISDTTSKLTPGPAAWQRRWYEIIFEADTPAGKAFDIGLLIGCPGPFVQDLINLAGAIIGVGDPFEIRIVNGAIHIAIGRDANSVGTSRLEWPPRSPASANRAAGSPPQTEPTGCSPFLRRRRKRQPVPDVGHYLEEYFGGLRRRPGV